MLMSASAEIAKLEEPVMSHVLRRTLLSKMGHFIFLMMAAGGSMAQSETKTTTVTASGNPNYTNENSKS